MFVEEKGGAKSILIISVVILGALVGLLTFWLDILPKPVVKPPADFFSCGQDSDCVSVKGDCCGCTAGGTAAAVNKNFAKDWEDKLSKECKDIACIQVISNAPSCFKDPKCIDNKCVLEEKSAAAGDICDIGKSDEGGVIFEEDDSNFASRKSQCELKSECGWKFLGGKIKRHFACCPNDLNSVITDENRETYGRCFLMVD